MLIAAIRPAETRTIDVKGMGSDELYDQVRAQLPDGWEISKVPVLLDKTTGGVTAAATIVRRDGVREIEADSMDALRALVPDGWQMLNVRKV